MDENKESIQAQATDLTWVLSRINSVGEQRSVPGWGAFSEIISDVNQPTTTVSMLPILQAPADDNDTLTTAMRRLMAISSNMGQKYTVNTADQPLYSRGKELVWANEEFKNVIFRMGGLNQVSMLETQLKQ